MAGSIVSFYDQFPRFDGIEIPIRGEDGYLNATAMSRVLEKRFTDWRKTKFAKRLLKRLSDRFGMPVDWENSPSAGQKPLVDYVRGSNSMWVHPTVAMSYAMSNPEFQADVNAWIFELMQYGAVNIHILQWTQEEFERGMEFNRDDIREMYGA
ncbi:MAG: KilA-N domain-containing protein [Cyanobacteria bacterium J06638_22]